jgi:hypothetical protein
MCRRRNKLSLLVPIKIGMRCNREAFPKKFFEKT